MKSYRNYYQRNKYEKLLGALFSPLAWLSRVIPKCNIAVFSSMNGFGIADNAKYLYLNYHEPKYWVTKNSTLVNSDAKIIYAYSLKGMLLQLVAKKAYYTHSIYDFVPNLIWGAKKINLWHGVPLKEIGPAIDNKNMGEEKSRRLAVWYKFFPYTYYMYCDEVICPDEKRVVDYTRYFSGSNPTILIEKQPRNLYAKKNEKEKKILLAPTFRKYAGQSLLEIYTQFGLFNVEKMSTLHALGYDVTLRPHPIDTDDLLSAAEFAHISIDASLDLYESITSYAYVITDYSSVYYDCMELGIPCYFYVPDLTIYQQINQLSEIYLSEMEGKQLAGIDDLINRIKGK